MPYIDGINGGHGVAPDGQVGLPERGDPAKVIGLLSMLLFPIPADKLGSLRGYLVRLQSPISFNDRKWTGLFSEWHISISEATP